MKEQKEKELDWYDKNINWSWWFYKQLGYRIIDSKEDKFVLNMVMNKLIDNLKKEGRMKALQEVFDKLKDGVSEYDMMDLKRWLRKELKL